jgi:hypothetical protein
MTANSSYHRVAVLFAMLACFAAAIPPARAEHPEIAKRRALERKTFTDAEIIDGFVKTTFGAELSFAGKVDRIRKFDRPVRVLVANRAKPDRRRHLAAIVGDIGARVRHLDIAITTKRDEANMIVTLVRERDFLPTIRRIYGRERAHQIARSLDPQCLAGFSKDESFRIVRSEVVLVVDGGDLVFYDCAYEEVLQALGPISDVDSIPWTMFNDSVQMGFFGVYDQYILNILYDPRIRPGMTAAEVLAVVPQVLPDVHAWVAQVNGLAR